MAGIRRKLGVALTALLPVAVASGCSPFLAFLTPTQPWVADRMEDKYQHTNDHRTPILPPIRDGFPTPMCEDPPGDREVLRTMPRVARGVPYVYEEFRDDVQIIKNRLVDTIDPPRFFPLIGMAQLHHCHWECVVYYTETVRSSYPFPTFIKKRRVQVIYIDKDHLHLYVGPNADQQRATTLEMTKY
jgi:hypothetical protein